jgi:hypothetical protein
MTSEHLTEISDVALVLAIGRWHQDALAEAYRPTSEPPGSQSGTGIPPVPEAWAGSVICVTLPVRPPH